MNDLTKAERLHSRAAIEKLFSGGTARSFSIYPLRVVYMPVEAREPAATMLISVPKKRFKRAVKRNLVKRQVREAYRLNKTLLTEPLSATGRGVSMAFIYIADELVPTSEIHTKVRTLLSRIAEKLS